MEMAIVEYGDDVAGAFVKEVQKEVAEVSFTKKKALDLMDCLAFLKQASSKQNVVLFAEIDHEKDIDRIHAFYQGLAVLEAETGKNIFKYFYEPGEASDEGVRGFAHIFVNYLFHPSKLDEKAGKKQIFEDFDPSEPGDF